MLTQAIAGAPKQTSAARIAANRANAQKSTGPRTPEGKAAVANNVGQRTGQPEAQPKVSSVVRDKETPGLRSERNPLDLANDTCLPSERDEFLETVTGFIDSLQPANPLETQLVERLAQLNLRLNRALRMETTHLNVHAASEETAMTTAGITRQPSNANQNNSLTMLAFLRDPNALTLIGRYESRLSRDFARTLAQIHQLQKLRKQTQASAGATTPTRSLASNGQVAPNPTEIPAEQTQPLTDAMPTRSRVREGTGINPAAHGHQIPAKQTQLAASATQPPLATSSQTNPTPISEAQA